MNITTILILLSILPSVVLGMIIYNMDKVEKEPPRLIASVFTAGMATVFLVLLTTEILELIAPFFSRDLFSLNSMELFVSIFAGVALIEEGFKWLAFKKYIWNHKEFDYMYDAIVYAVFISLGFATIENILYVIEGGIWVAFKRAIFSVPGHTFFAIYMGYYFGLAKQAEINGKISIKNNKLIKSILVPTLIHTFFNFCLFTGNDIMTTIYFAFMFILYIRSFGKIKQLSNIKIEMKEVV